MENAIKIFRKHNGQLRMSQAISEGISRYMLYSLRDQGIIERISRGVYRLADINSLSNPDFVTIGIRFPKAVICLISALAFHEMTTQIPHKISIAVVRDSNIPKLEYPPLSVHRFSKSVFEAGIEKHEVDGVRIQIYNPEKTLADCFKFRNKIGMDVVLEALKYYKSRKFFNVNKLLKYARICRVEKIMKPYLEALV